MLRNIGVPVIDLFAGAGGLSLGMSLAGADVRLSVEADATACQTLTANGHYHAGGVLEADVRDLTGATLRRKAGLKKNDTLLIVGGPPCQPFSKAAYWTDEGGESRFRRARSRGEEVARPTAPTEARPDERRTLVEEFLRLIVEAKADGFVFENVRSILHPRNRPTLLAFRKAAEDAGFRTTMVEANAVEFGVPQRRQRIFLLGQRRDTPPTPRPTHTLDEFGDLERLPAVTAGKVLEPFAGDEFAEPEELVRGRWATHLQEIPAGKNYKALTSWAGGLPAGGLRQ